MSESSKILLIGGGLTEVVIRTFVLEERGFKVTAADDYRATEPLLRHADLVILDWASADSTGAFRFLRETYPEVPVIVIASVPISEEVREDAAAVITHATLNSSLLPLVQLALHPVNRSKTNIPSQIRLGIGDAYVTVGQHLLLFWEEEAELQSLAGFLTAGLDTDDQLVLCGPSPANTLLTNALEKDGFQAGQLSSRGTLRVIEADDTKTAVPKLVEFFHSPERRGGVVRVVGNASGWEQVNDEDSLILHEGELDRVLAKSSCIAICPYRTLGLNSRTIYNGALMNHASVIVGNTLKDNPFYRPLT